MNRTEHILKITKRLIILVGVSLLLFTTASMVPIGDSEGGRIMVSCLVFICGLLGGFVSIQQRLKSISGAELDVLSRSWFQILLVPIYGGVFALILYVLFLSKIIDGHLFPDFHIPEVTKGSIPNNEFIQQLLWGTYPLAGEDLAKLIFWSFASGFSERLVPQIVSNVSDSQSDSGSIDEPGSRS